MSRPGTARSKPPRGTLAELARRAGLAVEWDDAQGRPQLVVDSVLRTLLDALGLPAGNAAQIQHSLATLEAESPKRRLPPLVTAELDRAIALPAALARSGVRYRIELEQGGVIDGNTSAPRGDVALIAPIGECGYHTLWIDDKRHTLAVAPERCFGIADAWLSRGRDAAVAPPQASAGSPAAGASSAALAPVPKLWGISAQMYGLRRAGDGGLSDYTALAELAQRAAAHGAHALAISPIHAMFSAEPQKFSPYSPSSRLFLNVLYVDMATIAGVDALAAAIDTLHLADELARLERMELIDWPTVARARLAIARRLFDQVTHNGAAVHALAGFGEFRAAGGQALEDHACFEALHAWRCATQPDGGHWRNWPEPLQDARSDEVAAFAAQHHDEVDFHLFLQWLAHRGRAAAQRAARGAGMAIGLVADLAVGCDSAGSHAWSYRHDMLQRVSVGAPPDIFNQAGQSWGLTTFSPRAMINQGFTAFIDMLRASFTHAGGIRIDHILGLRRLWLVPDGEAAANGAYLHYPQDDMLRLIALESWRHRAIVIGEDLGTVPPGFRERLARAGLLGIRVLWFERGSQEEARRADDAIAVAAGETRTDHRGGEDTQDAVHVSAGAEAEAENEFKLPESWSPDVLATTTTHDLPTLAGWWRGEDIDWRERIGQAGTSDGDDNTAAAHREREIDRARLWRALCDAGFAGAHTPTPAEPPIDAALAFVAATRSPLAGFPLEDLLGLADQPNLPGSIDEYPNWRRRLPREVAHVLDEPAVTRRLHAIDAARKRP